MHTIPRSALLLGLAGLIPFLWGALVASGTMNMHMGGPDDPNGYPIIVAQDGPKILLSYGAVILSFMSGVLWGFATRAAPPDRLWAYGLSVIPALWVFFNNGAPDAQLWRLAIGFLGLLALDWLYFRRGLAPDWWLWLRIPLTLVVVSCLVIGALV